MLAGDKGQNAVIFEIHANGIGFYRHCQPVPIMQPRQ